MAKGNQFEGWSHLQVSHSPGNIPAPTHSLVTLAVLMPMTTQERRKQVGGQIVDGCGGS